MAQASCRSRMAEASTMLRTMKRLMALSLGTCKEERKFKQQIHEDDATEGSSSA